ncbi:MAG: bifunctional oligoribonuclease/PAP phosphatase NrnA [Candidatus Zixiibacteriota bacterium]
MNAKTHNAISTTVMPAGAIREILLGARRILVASHIDPDGDALGTQLAFASYVRHLGKEPLLVRDSEVPHKYRFLHGAESIPRTESLPDDTTIDAAVILECPNIERIGTACRWLKDGLPIVNIDHHRDNAAFGRINWVDSSMSSVGEMVYEYFRADGYRPTADVAEQLYTAILTDTGRFRYSSTSPRTMAVAGELIAAGADPHKICNMVYYNVRPSTMKLIGAVLNTLEFHDHGRICLLTLTKQMLREAGAEESESDGLVDYTLFSEGVLAGALLKELDVARTKVSLRSANGINVSGIAAQFGGGGHYNAAGCTLPLPLERARAEIVRLLTEAGNG